MMEQVDAINRACELKVSKDLDQGNDYCNRIMEFKEIYNNGVDIADSRIFGYEDANPNYAITAMF